MPNVHTPAPNNRRAANIDVETLKTQSNAAAMTTVSAMLSHDAAIDGAARIAGALKSASQTIRVTNRTPAARRAVVRHWRPKPPKRETAPLTQIICDGAGTSGGKNATNWAEGRP